MVDLGGRNSNVRGVSKSREKVGSRKMGKCATVGKVQGQESNENCHELSQAKRAATNQRVSDEVRMPLKQRIAASMLANVCVIGAQDRLARPNQDCQVMEPGGHR
jgi:hypothetical protein